MVEGWRSAVTYLLLCLAIGFYAVVFPIAYEWAGWWAVVAVAIVVFFALLAFVTARDRDLKEKSNLRAD